MDELNIQKEVVDPIRDPALDELKERLVREYEDREKKARRREKWRRILGFGFFSKK